MRFRPYGIYWYTCKKVFKKHLHLFWFPDPGSGDGKLNVWQIKIIGFYTKSTKPCTPPVPPLPLQHGRKGGNIPSAGCTRFCRFRGKFFSSTEPKVFNWRCSVDDTTLSVRCVPRNVNIDSRRIADQTRDRIKIRWFSKVVIFHLYKFVHSNHRRLNR